jgi:hypothetical protein
MARLANSVPRDHGVRGAARGLERELKCLGAIQKSATVKSRRFLAPEAASRERRIGLFARAKDAM